MRVVEYIGGDLVKKAVSFCLLISLMCSLLFVSCKKDEAQNTPKEPEAGNDISQYTIVRPDASNIDFVKMVMSFRSEIKKLTGAELKIVTDEGEKTEKEIILGDTLRDESVAAGEELASAGDDTYLIKSENSKIIIYGNSDEVTVRAMKIFIEDHLSRGGVEALEGLCEKGSVNLDSVFLDEMALEYGVEYTCDLAVPEGDELLFSYETMIELSHNGENNGTLIATHAGLFGKYDGYRIHKSTDKGNTWTQISVAKDLYSNEYTNHITNPDCSLQPFLFELPKNVGDFKEGTLFLAALTRGEDYLTQTQSSAIMLYYSSDVGVTWEAYDTLATGGSATSQTGVWEPFLIYEEATGRVYCFYSDESNTTGTKNGSKAQEIVFRYTTDMKRWSKPQAVVSCSDKTNMRPGMCSITKLGDGRYYMVYEMVGELHNPVYSKICASGRLDDWGDPADRGTLVKSVDGKTFGSAPTCAWGNVGGECGVLVVTGHHMIDGKAISGATDIFISFDYGKTFAAMENPLPYKQLLVEERKKCGYSSYFGFSSDGRYLYYLNSVNVDDVRNQSKVSFARIKIW